MSEGEKCYTPHNDESHEGGESLPDLCTQSCPAPDRQGCNEGAVAEASEASKDTCIIDHIVCTHWTNVLHSAKECMMTPSYCTIMMMSSCSVSKHNSFTSLYLQKTFRVTKEKFAKLPSWKQANFKKDVRLF